MIAPKPTITIVVDNQAGDGLLAEHGLSLWIDAGDTRILFDTGQGAALAYNAGKLEIGLEQTDILVLSHGHYDHSGGIPLVLKAARQAKVYCHPGVVQPRYSTRNGMAKEIHMPRESMAAIDKLPAEKLNWMSRARLVARGIGLTGPIPRETDYEDTGGPFFLDPQARRADPIKDDLALWIRTEQGLIVCVGCCHAGVVNTLRHVFRLSGINRLRALIGGLHLLNAQEERLAQTVAALHDFAPELIVPCHCTGHKATQLLTSSFGERVVPGSAGARYSF
jgi:7,8-dihydropterin-6-yl-methyl-4-(beta-D-ribofuranosyl)aminobenzene 5'-phosphate synthase